MGWLTSPSQEQLEILNSPDKSLPGVKKVYFARLVGWCARLLSFLPPAVQSKEGPFRTAGVPVAECSLTIISGQWQWRCTCNKCIICTMKVEFQTDEAYVRTGVLAWFRNGMRVWREQ